MEREQFLEKLKQLNLNKKDFSELSEVPYSTVNAWGSTQKGKVLPLPAWVKHFLKYYEDSRKLHYFTNEICQKVQEIKNQSSFKE